MADKIVFLDRESFPAHIQIRRPAVAHEWTEYAGTQPEQVAGRLTDATIAISNKVPIGRAVLDACPNLKMISVSATGVDMIDLDACRERSIVVTNVRGYAAQSVPEHTFALILALRRGLMGYRRDVADGTWQRSGRFCLFTHPITDLHGARLGIIGNGELGSAVAAIGKAGFGMEPVFLDHASVTDEKRQTKTFLPHDEFMRTADVVTVHSPLTDQTRGLLNQNAFTLMKPSAIVINTARGAIVNEVDLAAAVAEGKIAGAAVDVMSSEPPPEDHPFMALADHPNFIITPHVAWASTDAMQRLADQTIDNIEQFVAGTPGNVIV